MKDIRDDEAAVKKIKDVVEYYIVEVGKSWEENGVDDFTAEDVRVCVYEQMKDLVRDCLELNDFL